MQTERATQRGDYRHHSCYAGGDRESDFPMEEGWPSRDWHLEAAKSGETLKVILRQINKVTEEINQIAVASEKRRPPRTRSRRTSSRFPRRYGRRPRGSSRTPRLRRNWRAFRRISKHWSASSLRANNSRPQCTRQCAAFPYSGPSFRHPIDIFPDTLLQLVFGPIAEFVLKSAYIDRLDGGGGRVALQLNLTIRDRLLYRGGHLL